MTYAELRSQGFPFGRNCEPPADLAGAFVDGSPSAPRHVVAAEPLFRAYHELDDIDPDREAYATVYQYPPDEYREHVRRISSPRGYCGPAACCRLVWDIDRPDPAEALADARTLGRFLTDRYSEDAVGAYFSGAKGYHLSVVAPPGFHPLPHVPAVVKLLCLTVARAAGVRVDGAIYDVQRILRLPNSKHGKTGLHKRFLDPEELFALDAGRIRELARHPAGFAVPSVAELNANLERDWLEAERRVLDAGPPAGFGSAVRPDAPSRCPVVPQFVRAFIGFGDIADPGRAVTLFRAAAALAEARTPAAVVVGLLEEPALKTGLAPDEVAKQIADGIAHGRRTHDATRRPDDDAPDWRPRFVAEVERRLGPVSEVGATTRPSYTRGRGDAMTPPAPKYTTAAAVARSPALDLDEGPECWHAGPPFDDLDIRPGRVILLGPPGAGKTTLALQVTSGVLANHPGLRAVAANVEMTARSSRSSSPGSPASRSTRSRTGP